MKRQRRQRRAITVILLILGLILVLVGGWDLLHIGGGKPKKVPATQDVIPPNLFEGLLPLGPTPPSGTRIRLVNVGIDLPVVPGDGWSAPLYKAATYPGLKLPGEGGRSMIYAHARVGMFGPLVRSKIGQPVEIDEPDGTVYHYQISEIHPVWPANNLKWLQPLAQEQLVLTTCTTYDPNDPRVVVVALPVSGPD